MIPNPNPNGTKPPPQQYVVTIDFGTTKSGVSYISTWNLNQNHGDVKLLKWGTTGIEKDDTAMLLQRENAKSKEWKCTAIGSDAQKELQNLRLRKIPKDNYCLVGNMKLALFQLATNQKKKNSLWAGLFAGVAEALKSVFRIGEPSLDVENVWLASSGRWLVDLLMEKADDFKGDVTFRVGSQKFLLSFLLEQFFAMLGSKTLTQLTHESQISGATKLTFKDVRWLISVPAVWSMRVSEFVLDCARSALKDGRPDKVLVESVDESRCSLLSIWRSETHAFGEVGKTYMVLDAGGGTMSFVAYKTVRRGDSVKFEQIPGSYHGAFGGGCFANTHFVQGLLSAIPGSKQQKQLANLIKDNNEHFLQLMALFEEEKRVLKHGTPLCIDLSRFPRTGTASETAIYDCLSCFPRDPARGIYFDGRCLIVAWETILELHEPLLKELVVNLEVALKKIGNAGMLDRQEGGFKVDYLFLTGGLGSSELCSNYLKRQEKVSSLVSKVVPMSDGHLNVLRGGPWISSLDKAHYQAHSIDLPIFVATDSTRMQMDSDTIVVGEKLWTLSTQTLIAKNRVLLPEDEVVFTLSPRCVGEKSAVVHVLEDGSHAFFVQTDYPRDDRLKFWMSAGGCASVPTFRRSEVMDSHLGTHRSSLQTMESTVLPKKSLHVVLMLDSSASMRKKSAQTGILSRFDRAVDFMWGLVEMFSDTRQLLRSTDNAAGIVDLDVLFTLVQFDHKAGVLALGVDKKEIEKFLNSKQSVNRGEMVRSGSGATDLKGALEMASKLMMRDRENVVVVASDFEEEEQQSSVGGGPKKREEKTTPPTAAAVFVNAVLFLGNDQEQSMEQRRKALETAREIGKQNGLHFVVERDVGRVVRSFGMLYASSVFWPGQFVGVQLFPSQFGEDDDLKAICIPGGESGFSWSAEDGEESNYQKDFLGEDRHFQEALKETMKEYEAEDARIVRAGIFLSEEEEKKKRADEARLAEEALLKEALQDDDDLFQ